MPLNAREAALKAISAWRKNGAWSDSFLGNLFDRESMDSRDRALAARICYGVLQNLYLCDYYISRCSSITINKLEPMVADILRISVYQLAFLDKIPVSAAVDEAVKLAKKHSNKRAAGFVNAVLRRFSAERDNLPEPEGNSFAEKLSIKYSHPVWFAEYLINRIGADECEQYLISDNSEPGITAFVNTLKTDVNSAVKMLEKDGVSVSRDIDICNALFLKATGSIERLEAFESGMIYIQDVAANLAIHAASPKAGMTVIDGCAAPGGKTVACAIKMENKGRIISTDIHKNKINRITQSCSRLGISIVTADMLDSREERKEYLEIADAVIADVPCSGLGVIRKKPEIRYKTPEEIEKLPEIQYNILSNLSKYVKRGGTLLYSTCTVIKAENEDVVKRFLSEHSDFSTDTFTLPRVGYVEKGFVTLYPHVNNTDGFFICRMIREA